VRAGEPGWAILASAVLSGELRPIRIKAKARCALERLEFPYEKSVEWINARSGPPNELLTLAAAARSVGISAQSMAQLADRGAIQTVPDPLGTQRRKIRPDALKAFKSRFVSVGSLARRWARHPHLVKLSLSHHGVNMVEFNGMQSDLVELSSLPAPFRVLTRKELSELGLRTDGIQIRRRPNG